MEEFDVYRYIQLGKDLGLVGKDLLRYVDTKEANYYERQEMMLDIEYEQCVKKIREMLLSLRMMVATHRKEDDCDMEKVILLRRGKIAADGDGMQRRVVEEEVTHGDFVTELVEDNVPGTYLATSDGADDEVLVGTELVEEEPCFSEEAVSFWKGQRDLTTSLSFLWHIQTDEVSAQRMTNMDIRNVGFEEFGHQWDEIERSGKTLCNMDWDHG